MEGVMIWPFKKKPVQSIAILPFKSGHAFVEYQCKFGHTKIEQNKGIFAVVLDSRKEFRTHESVKIDKNGVQTAALRVASDDGGFNVLATTPSGKGDPLKPDDVVVWVPMQYSKEMASVSDDARFGWVGLILAKVKPEIDMSKDAPSVICRYK
jgi:hypothetical protein